ncbi:Transmembrane protein 18-like [Oopsacas minuta]|uniref:Transmembrane protein 18-like n=1 Tax=Oopsacas minuta TaxID=111878 RepID=A0AAV7JTN1_9METZ|nr:Transmembrane protein 18-like [Oopsacas minuta]
MEDIFTNVLNFSAWLPKPSSFDEDDPSAVLEILKGTDWTQPWLIGIIIFHFLSLFLSIYLRKSLLYQCISLIVFTLLALSSEIFNEYASIYWERFADDAYFDSAGLFITLIFNMPLLVNIFVTVILAICNATDDLIQLKKLELSQKNKKTK